MTRKFWMVLKATGSSTSMRHDTFQKACNEASRLAQKHNEDFFVMEAIGIVGPIVPQVVYQELPNEPGEF